MNTAKDQDGARMHRFKLAGAAAKRASATGELGPGVTRLRLALLQQQPRGPQAQQAAGAAAALEGAWVQAAGRADVALGAADVLAAIRQLVPGALAMDAYARPLSH